MTETWKIYRNWPKLQSLGKKSVLLYDRKLEALVPGFSELLKFFPLALALDAGEQLKQVEAFPANLARFAELADKIPSRDLCVVAVGGGSIGDYAGFIASIYHRGVELIHIPSTWLAALDSSHGGKTALNVGGSKNQIGTFYPANSVYLIQPLLFAQNPQRMTEALGELAKIAIVDGGKWTQNLALKVAGIADLQNLLWRALPHAIRAKMKVVKKDPFEKTGYRQILNLGHTLGHVLEAELGISHGESVAFGLEFALQWSRHKKIISEKNFAKIKDFILLSLRMDALFKAEKPCLEEARWLKHLRSDKKRKGKGLTFIFVKQFGQVVREIVTLEQMTKEAKRQGFLL